MSHRSQSSGGGISQISFGQDKTNIAMNNDSTQMAQKPSTLSAYGMNDNQLDLKLKSLMIPDLRQELRARGLSPAGGMESLRERLKEALKSELANGRPAPTPTPAYEEEPMMMERSEGHPTSADGAFALPSERGQAPTGFKVNNYSRPEGQNVGNFMSDRPSSRVLKAPGGGSSITFG